MAVPKKKSIANETTSRHLWLAGLGLVAVTRKQAMAAVARAFDGLGALKQQVEDDAADARANIRHGIDGLRGQVEPKVAEFGAELESRLAPVLAKLGLKTRTMAQRKGRKPATKKPIHRAAARKPAKAVKRLVRKARL